MKTLLFEPCVRRLPPAVFLLTSCALVAGALLADSKATAGKVPESAAPDAVTSRILGRVRDSSGGAIAGARIHVLRDGLSARTIDRDPDVWTPPSVSDSAQDGTFVVDGLEGETFDVRVSASDLASVTLENIPVGASVTAHLNAGYPLKGRVLDATTRKPLPGSRIVVCDERALDFGRDACVETLSDEDGGFEYRHLPQGRIELRATAASHAVSDVAEIGLPRREADGPTLYLGPGAQVAGTVVDDAGHPVEGARVEARPLASTPSAPRRDDREWPVLTAADGSFVFQGLPSGVAYRVTAARADRAVAVAGPVRVAAGRDVSDLRITMARPAWLVFRLVDENGTSVDDYEIYFRDSAAVERGFAGPVERDWGSRLENGAGEIRILRSGTFDFLFAPEDLAEVVRKEVVLTPARTTDLGDLVVTEGTSVAGRVTDEDDLPVIDATVEASWDVEGDTRRRSSRTDGDGQYRISGLGESPLRVSASAPGHSPADLDDVTPDRTDVDLVLRPAGGVKGQVEVAGGEPLSSFNILVHVEAESLAENPNRYRGFPRKRPFGADEGQYTMNDLPPGRYTIEARADGWAPGRRSGVTVAAGRVTDVEKITLHEGITLRGRVVDAAAGAPVAGAKVAATRVRQAGWMSSPSASFETVQVTGEDGRFEFDGLEPGELSVGVSHPGFATTVERFALRAVEISEERVIRLSVGGSLTGTVSDAEGRPSPGRTLTVQTASTDDDPGFATTDDEGRYEMTRLAPGGYEVVLVPEGLRGGSLQVKPAAIREDEVTVLDFDEDHRITLSGRVLRDDEPLGNVDLIFADAGGSLTLGSVKLGRSDAVGRYEVGLDGPGTFRVLAGTGTGSASARITVPDEERVHRDIELGSDGITGRVFDENGGPVPNVVVTARADHAPPGDPAALLVADTDAGGAYAISGLTPGIYRVSASAEGYRVDIAYPVEVPEGSRVSEVDFHLERGRTVRGRLVDGEERGIPGGHVFVGPTGTADPLALGAAGSVTDVNGAFELTAPSEGALDLTGIAAGWAPARLVGVLPPADPDTPGPLLRATRGGTLRIQVVGAGDSLPRAGVRLGLRALPPFLASEIATLLTPLPPTDADGRSRVNHLAVGGYELRVEGQGGNAPGHLTVNEDAETVVLIEVP